MKKQNENEGSLKILIRNLRTRKYEKYKISTDQVLLLQEKDGQDHQS